MDNDIVTTHDKNHPKHIYLIAIAVLIILHFVAGVFFMPAIMYRYHSEYGIPLLYLKIGYGLGAILWFGILPPLVISLLALIKKTNRNILSFLKVYSYLCIVCLVINILIGYRMRNI